MLDFLFTLLSGTSTCYETNDILSGGTLYDDEARLASTVTVGTATTSTTSSMLANKEPRKYQSADIEKTETVVSYVESLSNDEISELVGNIDELLANLDNNEEEKTRKL